MMNNLEFAKELAKRKGISEMSAYRYINTVMDTIRQLLAEGEEVRIGGFGRFTVISDISGNRMPAFVSGKAFRMAVGEREGIV